MHATAYVHQFEGNLLSHVLTLTLGDSSLSYKQLKAAGAGADVVVLYTIPVVFTPQTLAAI